MNTLDHLSRVTKIVTDTGLFYSIKKYEPCDSTTNPSLILAAVKDPEYAAFLKEATSYAKEIKCSKDERLEIAMDRVLYLFGVEILKIVPGRVSVEVDARLSFDTEKTVAKALKIISIFEKEGISKERILIKIAATWEGGQAAKILETEHGIHCNLTLIFSLAQVRVALDANATLISPFVGRVSDWFKINGPDHGSVDHGVALVTKIFNYVKAQGSKTQVMGASFRSTEQVLALTGCDLLTVSPSILDSIMGMKFFPEIKLIAENVQPKPKEKSLNQSEYLWMINEDKMATDLLSDGIRRFGKDARILEKMILDDLS